MAANKFTKHAYKKHPYSDPTYLSFSLSFITGDAKHSPLFGKDTYNFVKDFCKDEDRAKSLNDFKMYLELFRELDSFLC